MHLTRSGGVTYGMSYRKQQQIKGQENDRVRIRKTMRTQPRLRLQLYEVRVIRKVSTLPKSVDNMAKVKDLIKALQTLDPEANISYGEGISRGVKHYPINEIRKFHGDYLLAGMINMPMVNYTTYVLDI